jgi:hypothetical protein
METTDLTLVPTEDLVAEVLSRCDHGAIVMLRCLDTGPTGTQNCQTWRTGNTYTIAGLLTAAASRVIREYEAKEISEKEN